VTKAAQRARISQRSLRLRPTIAVAIGLSLSFSSAIAQIVTEIPVRTSRAGEFQPAADDGYIGWQQNTRARPNLYNAYAKPDGEPVFKVNAPRTQADMGGIDGTTLVYQQWRRRQSDLKFLDLDTKKRSNPPAGVNTRHWEYSPSVSGDWLLFGRITRGRSAIVLHALTSGNERRLDNTRRTFKSPGQVSGNYAVWTRCNPNFTGCEAFLHDIGANTTTRIPNPTNFQGGASVASDGTVYMTRAPGFCRSVKLFRYPLGGPATLLVRFGRGRDSFNSQVFSDSDGDRHVVYERRVCSNPAASDIYKVIDSFTLSVTKAGTGSGTVTSTPAGIDCGPDCAEVYGGGTSVTLTAVPDGGSTFTGWGGDCTGTDECMLVMDDDQSAEATFDSP